jgi:hypothetical protein
VEITEHLEELLALGVLFSDTLQGVPEDLDLSRAAGEEFAHGSGFVGVKRSR